jgi:uncharacterized protein
MPMLYVKPVPRNAVLSPCIGVCELRADGLCAGCLRSSAEIAAWSTLSDGARLDLMDRVLPLRAAERS